MRFHEQLRSLLKKAGWTQTELGKRSGVGQATVSNWFARDAVPGWDAVCAVADAFGVSTEYFRDESAEAPREIVVRVLLGKVGGPHKLVHEVPIVLQLQAK